MDEFMRVVSDKEFQKELNKLREIVKSRRNAGCNRNDITNFLVGWVTAPTIKGYMPDQLRQIFDLADEKVEEVS